MLSMISTGENSASKGGVNEALQGAGVGLELGAMSVKLRLRRLSSRMVIEVTTALRLLPRPRRRAVGRGVRLRALLGACKATC